MNNSTVLDKYVLSFRKKISFKKNGKSISIKSIAVQHGRILSQSFIINKSCAYVSDANKIYSKDLKYFKNLKYLVIDCLRLDQWKEISKYLYPYFNILNSCHFSIIPSATPYSRNAIF